MFILALIWLWLLIDELVFGLSPVQERVLVGIWITFIFEFLLKFLLAPRKLDYVNSNWITLVALVIPAFRVFRMLRAIRILQASQVTSTTRIIRSLTSARRFVADVKAMQGEKIEGEMNVGVVLACSRSAVIEEFQPFINQLIADAAPEIASASGIRWFFHQTEPVRLESDEPRMPSDFLDDASTRMAEGPFDLIIVVTDVALISRKKKMEAGLASPVSHVLVISTRRLISAPRGKPARPLESLPVRYNAAILLLHLLGRISGLARKKPYESKIMAPFEFQENRSSTPNFSESERKALQQQASHLPERELHGGKALESLIFHVLMALTHPRKILQPLLRNRAPLLPLALPGLATAAVAPTFLLVFTAEIWDVGLNMSNRTTAIYATLSILGASFYLVRVQSLFFPRQGKRVLTEHLALANSVIFLTVLLACIGLFLMVAALMLLIEIYIFPEGLMSTWPTLETAEILFPDKFRLAAFISTIGVTTGALAGGMESRTLIRKLALYNDEP